MKICISLIPIFIVAAFFESYITHLMSNAFDKDSANIGLPIPVSLAILLGSFIFIAWYFVIHPIRLHRKGYFIQPDGIIHRLKQEHA